MSHSRDGNRKEELNLQNTVSLCFKGLIIPWFVSLNPADSRSTILFLYIDEVERKAPT
jgi:hypothetical protein